VRPRPYVAKEAAPDEEIEAALFRIVRASGGTDSALAFRRFRLMILVAAPHEGGRPDRYPAHPGHLARIAGAALRAMAWLFWFAPHRRWRSLPRAYEVHRPRGARA
jgi:hypothetical protein